MIIKKSQIIFLLNILLFGSVILSNGYVVITNFFCLVGILLNLFIFGKETIPSFQPKKACNSNVNGPDFSEQREIMDDLEREIAHRREIEKLNKN